MFTTDTKVVGMGTGELATFCSTLIFYLKRKTTGWYRLDSPPAFQLCHSVRNLSRRCLQGRAVVNDDRLIVSVPSSFLALR